MMKKSNDITPIFLLSLPRSGSTLLQRLLLTNIDIASASEPWIILPLLNTLKKENTHSVYGHQITVDAIEDFYSLFENNKDDYLKEIRTFVLSLYAKAAHNRPYFLDKTPRYSLIAEEIYQAFPEGKYIILWRNPLAIIASALETWKNGKWSTSHLKIDLYCGLENLINFHENYCNDIASIRYEDITKDIKELKRIFEYLELEYCEEDILKFSNVKLSGRMGDPIGTYKYSSVKNDSEDKWKSTLASPVRKLWCRNYLKWIGEKRLGIMGYNLEHLLKELDDIPVEYKFIFIDIVRLIYGEINVFFGIEDILVNIRKIFSNKKLYPFF